MTTAEVCRPDEVGIDPARVSELVERARTEVEGPGAVLRSAQLAVARNGRLLCAETFGDAPPDARFNVFSVTKAFVAATVWRLLGDGSLREQDRVVEHFPEFGANGKDQVTVEQLLTHTAGFPTAPLGPPEWFDRDARIAKMASWRLNWEPGTQMEYHPSSAHWVLAELVERLRGRDHRDVIHEEVMVPLGLDRLRVGCTPTHPDDWSDVPEIRMVGEPPRPEDVEALLGFAVDFGEVTDDAVLRFNQREVRDLGVPGGGGIACAADVALFYQGLLHDPAGLWDPAVLADGTGSIRCTMTDPLLGVAANRTLGLIVAGDDGQSMRRGFGRTVSGRAFGHLGAGAQVAWADPETGVSFCFVTNDHEVDLLAEGRRIHALNNRAGALVDR